MTPQLEKIAELSNHYEQILIFDHHETLLKNLDAWIQSKIQNFNLFYSKEQAACHIFFSFLKANILEFEKTLEKRFFSDIYQKMKYINLNDTSIVESEKICSFIEYAKKMGSNEIKSCPEKDSLKILKKKHTIM